MLYIVVGYFVFKIAKNGIQFTLSNLQKTKELAESADLKQCTNCESFVSREIALTHKKKIFCSEDCIKAYEENQS